MRDPVGATAAAVLGYALGTVPSAAIAARLAGADGDVVNERGTGNPGAMNASHVLGRGWGAAVSVADIAKGVAASAVGRRLAGERGANVAATAAVVGHCHPPRRTGGKGVATSIGQVVGTFPVYLPIDVGVAVSTAAVPWFRRRTEVATLTAAAAWIACALTWWRKGWSCGLRRPTTPAVAAGAVASSAVIFTRFRAERGRVDGYNRQDGDRP